MEKIILNFIADKDTTIGEFLINKGFSSQNIYQEIKFKNVLVNECVIDTKHYPIKIKDIIKVTLNDEENTLKENSNSFDILYEDQYLMVVNKPYNLNIQPVFYAETNNLSSMITFYYRQKGIKSMVHTINRLDKLARGLVIVAKNRYIKNLFKDITINKKYKCLVEGVTEQSGIIKNQILKDEITKQRVVVQEGGKECVTEYNRLETIDGNSVLDVTIKTGRTHQIRTSMASIGHPLVGDPLYNKNISEQEMYLCAYYLSFNHPITGKLIEISLQN